MSSSESLTPKQKRFVREYLVDLNATKAATRTGYSRRTAKQQGSRLLTNVVVKAEIEAQMEKLREGHAITADYVIAGIMDAIERVMQARPVLDKQGHQVYVETPDGKVAAAYTFNAMAALKGYELLGKHLGMFGEARAPKRPLQDDPRLQEAIDKLVPKPRVQ